MVKKIILIRPKNVISEEYKYYPPLGLIHVGSILEKAGYSVKILDLAMGDKIEKYKDAIKNSIIVGITALTPEIKNACEISDQIKSFCDVPIVFGGWHATLFPEQTCNDNSIDFVIPGEGEYVMFNLQLIELKYIFNRI